MDSAEKKNPSSLMANELQTILTHAMKSIKITSWKNYTNMYKTLKNPTVQKTV
jgi:hypothetical protein